MPSLPLEVLPAETRLACERLRDALEDALGAELVALWTYGAATFPDCPGGLGDVDTHGVLTHAPGAETSRKIEAIHDAIENDLGIEWDSWYILESDVTSAKPPKHALHEHLVDDAWALHRAHWLAGQYIALSGTPPTDFVPPPSWEELQGALRKEISFIEQFVTERRDDPGHAAYAMLNGCRVLYSVEARNVVISKWAAGLWALKSLEKTWHAPIQAAMRLYDAETMPGDAPLLTESMAPFIGFVRDRAVLK